MPPRRRALRRRPLSFGAYSIIIGRQAIEDRQLRGDRSTEVDHRFSDGPCRLQSRAIGLGPGDRLREEFDSLVKLRE